MCVVIYEVVAGTCPFVAENYHAQLRAIIEEKPTPIAEVSGRRRRALDDRFRAASEKDRGRALAVDARARRRARGNGVSRRTWRRTCRGALLSLEWAEAVVRRPLSERRRRSPGARRRHLPARFVGSEPRRRARVERCRRGASCRVAWPSRAERETMPAEVPPRRARAAGRRRCRSRRRRTRRTRRSAAHVGARRRRRSGSAGRRGAGPSPEAGRARVQVDPRGRRSPPAPPPVSLGASVPRRTQRRSAADDRRSAARRCSPSPLAGVGEAGRHAQATPIREAIGERYGKPAPTIPPTPEPPHPSARAATFREPARRRDRRADVESAPSSGASASR